MSDLETEEQRNLEKPVKGWQLLRVQEELQTMNTTLTHILAQTKGVVSFEVMEKYVDKRIDEKVKHLVEHKNASTKLGWTLLVLIIGDIASRIFGILK